MYKHLLFFLFCCIFLFSCGDTGDARNVEPITAKPLDLTITPEMLDKYVSQYMEVVDINSTKDVIFVPSSRSYDVESPVKVRGELFYDETRGHNLDAIDGAAINLEFRFK